MRAASELHDSRINAFNVLVEMTIEEYCSIAAAVTENNVFQRKRVKSSKSVYSLLKQDLLKECVIPPIVLALTSNSNEYVRNDLLNFPKYILDNKEHLVILDGLQRTYTILELISELRILGDETALRRTLDNKLRVEFYVGINRIGILYRMLTLNTGQTPMSLRQQIEILYLDYLNAPIGGIELLREVDGATASKENQYNFKDVVEGFNSYIDRDELPIEKADILENISSLEKLSKENQSVDLFSEYLKSWHNFVAKVNQLAAGTKIGDDYLAENSSPFGRTALQVFKKPQAMSGFGAAAGRMIDREVIVNFSDINRVTASLKCDDPEEFLEEINNSLEWIRRNSNKIGNAQRSYFHFFFRELLNKDSDSYGSLFDSSKSALRKYQGINS